ADHLVVFDDRQPLDMVAFHEPHGIGQRRVGLTVRTSCVMTSRTLRPLNRMYSSASWPGPMKNSTHLGRWRLVPISGRRRKSPSVTMPTRFPRSSTTGSPLIFFCNMSLAATATDSSGDTEATWEVIMSRTFMTDILP